MMAAEEAERLKDITQYPGTVFGRHMTESICSLLAPGSLFDDPALRTGWRRRHRSATKRSMPTPWQSIVKAEADGAGE